MKNILMIILVGILGFSFSPKKVETIHIKTSAVCGECKERIEDKLNYTKGIVFAELLLETNVLTVKYKTKHLTEDQVKNIVSNLGYHADDVPRNDEVFKALPECCRDANAKCSRK